MSQMTAEAGETCEFFMSQFTILESWSLPPYLRIRALFIGIFSDGSILEVHAVEKWAFSFPHFWLKNLANNEEEKPCSTCL